MTWTQMYDPMGSLALSSLVAAIPMIIIFYMLAIRRTPGHIAGAVAVTSAVLIAILAYKMPAGMALSVTGVGALYGIFPIFWNSTPKQAKIYKPRLEKSNCLLL